MNKSTLILILFITFLPEFAFAKPPNEPVGPVKPVEVVNDEDNPVPVSIVDGGENGGQTASEYRFVRATSTSHFGAISHPDGFSGYLAMHRHCQEITQTPVHVSHRR
ncbi:MAG: hypothetical protein OEQ24_12400 [Gammaproteobacteria bacterium]|nr:hypothetical protein [Gammaproteobacteria bacterium]